jgi:hypothetical protein
VSAVVVGGLVTAVVVVAMVAIVAKQREIIEYLLARDAKIRLARRNRGGG